jgi:cell division protein FtsX
MKFKKIWFGYAFLLGLGFASLALRAMYWLVMVILADDIDWKKTLIILPTLLILSVISWLFIKIGIERVKED